MDTIVHKKNLKDAGIRSPAIAFHGVTDRGIHTKYIVAYMLIGSHRIVISEDNTLVVQYSDTKRKKHIAAETCGCGTRFRLEQLIFRVWSL